MKSLVIVESPKKAKTISRYLSNNYIVKATKGHVVDLPKNRFSVDVNNNFKPEYEIIKGKRSVVKDLKATAKKVSDIYLASDPDREGEAIAYHIAEQIKNKNNVLHRLLLSEITENGIKEGFANLKELDRNKVDAQKARRILDRMVGYMVSPVLWRVITATRGLSAGRVQSVALRLICEREERIRNFVSEEYWSIIAKFLKGNTSFEAKLMKIDSKKATIKNDDDARAVCENIKDLEFKISDFKRSEKHRHPPPPFITSTLQMEASTKLGFSANKTMAVAQQLYEGVEIEGKDSVGLITYMRTDSFRVAANANRGLRKFIEKRYGKEYVSPKVLFYKDRSGAQGAHEAIRPTSVEREPNEVKKNITTDQFKLYDLIWRRFCAQQMSAAVYSADRADIQGGKYLFRATGSKVKFPGFLKVYPVKEKKEGNVIPELKLGEPVKLGGVTPNQHFTEPPPRYTEASLIKELEHRGIGRPSTYAPIVSIIKKRGYVEKLDGKFHPTDIGSVVNDFVVSRFNHIFDVGFTAEMESQLDEIENGKERWIDTLRRFYEPFGKMVEEVKSDVKNIKTELQRPTGDICEICGKPMVVKWGKYGKFISCSGYPECKNIKKTDENIQTEEVCEVCGGRLVIKEGKYGRFLACSNYPKCTFTKSISVGVPCPQKGCGGEIVEKRSKRGRVFYACNNYPKCKFTLSNLPVSKKCNNCGANFLLDKGEYYLCYSCKTRFEKSNM